MASAPISSGGETPSSEISTEPTAFAFSRTGNPVLFEAQGGSIYRHLVDSRPDGGDAAAMDGLAISESLLIEFAANGANDDGGLNARQHYATGMALSEDDDGNDVLFISSLVWPPGAGADGDPDENTGQINRIALDPDTGAVLSNVALVRGLRRLDGAPAGNGLGLSVDPVTGERFLWIAAAGLFDADGPATAADLARSDAPGAFLKLDLDRLETFDVRTGADGDSFVLDLSTPDDGTTATSASTVVLRGADRGDRPDAGNLDGTQVDAGAAATGSGHATIGDFALVSKGGRLEHVSNPVTMRAAGSHDGGDVFAPKPGDGFHFSDFQPVTSSDAMIADATPELTASEIGQPAGAALAAEAITFASTSLTGELSTNPTALDFSKTGNPVLFVTQQDGKIYRYEIERRADGPDADTTDDFVATKADLINVIPQQTQNYNDTGSANSTLQRQMTGLAVTKDAAGNDVLYVSSSDWRISVGTDSGLDTNSGQIHRIVLDPDTGAVLSNVALVRGLPRSEENHSVNGLDLSVDPVTGDTYLWLAVGGETNKGAPGNNFSGTVDLAFAASILKINLTDLESYDVRTDASGDQFIMDLSTLDDPSRPNVNLANLNIQNLSADPNFSLDNNGSVGGVLRPDWAGGNNGLNQAKITDFVLVSDNGQLKLVDNPLSIYAPGFRNPYDVLVMQNGEVFTWDNGPNGGWGGPPLSFSDGQIVNDWTTELATNLFNETGSAAFGDQLHYLGEITDQYGPYGGHAHPIRAAKEALDAAFNTNGTYKGATSSTPITVNGQQLFANEAQARDYLAKLLIIYEEQGDGNWVDVTSRTGLPPDLFDVVSGYDWKHPGSSLSNPLAFFDGTSIMNGTVYSPESQLIDFSADGSLLLTPETTNGLVEYRGTFFGGALQGTIVAASFNETLYFAKPVDTDGDGRADAASIVHTITDFGSNPLAVAALPDFGLSPELIDNNGDGIDDFAGLVVSANHGNDNIVFFIPGGTPTDPGNDMDLDGLNNIVDSHVGDPLDGKGVLIGSGETERWGFELNNPSSTPPGAVPPGDSIAGDIGINAMWRNNVLPQVDNGGNEAAGLFNGGLWNLGGASTFVSIDRADDGAAEGTANTQHDVLGIGFAAQAASQLSIVSEMVNIFTYSLNNDPPAKVWNGGEKVGLFVGPGDQSNFVEGTIAVVNQGGTIKYGVQLIVEENDVFVSRFVEIPGIQAPVVQGLGDPNFQVAIDLDLASGSETASARARYVNDGVFTDWVSTEAVALPADVVAAVKGQYDNLGTDTGSVVGLVSSTTPGDDSFAASWDWVDVQNAGSGTGTGAVRMGIKETSNNVQTSNFGVGSFVLTNVGEKVVTKVEIDVTDAVLKDAVFDPFGIAGDTVNKALTIDSAGSTGVVAPNNDPNDPNNQTYVGAGGTAGYEGIVLNFNPAVSGGFQPGETVTFSVDMDPNSIAGAKKSVLNSGTSPTWDTGGISGAELIGSTFTITYADGTTSTGYLNGADNQGGSKGLSSQSAPNLQATLAVNGLDPGEAGTYQAGGPSVVVSGQAGQTARVVLVKGFIQPVTNEFHNGSSSEQAYAPQLDAQLAALAASAFPANNAVEVQTVDVVLTGGAQNISSLFNFSGVAAFNFGGENQVPLAFTAAIIDPSNSDLPKGPVTEPIYLKFGSGGADGTPPVVQSASAPDIGSAAAGTTTTTVTVVFADNVAVDVSTIDVGDITVTGPSGGLSVTSVGVSSGTDGTPRTATYTVAAPGGTWDAADDGTYSVALDAGEVLDTSGNAVAADTTLTDFSADLSAPPQQPFRVEAETFDLISGFVVKSNSSASGNQIIQASGTAAHRASYTFGSAAGAYDLKLGYYDESDGQSQLSLLVNGTVIDTFTWNLDLPSANANGITDAVHTFAGVDLAQGDVIELTGTPNGGEPLRVDYLEFAFTGSGDPTVPVVQSASAPDIGPAQAGTATSTVTVAFADNVAVNVSSIGTADIAVTGPGGGAVTVSSVSVSPSTNGTPRTATYTIAAPGGSWDAADAGSYAVALKANQVFDTSGNAVAANAALAGFTVNLSPPEPFRVEAETFSLISGFAIKANGSASGDQIIQASGTAAHRASFAFTAAAGTYDLKLGYYDESDGQSQLSLLVNGTAVDSFVWNLDLPSANANGITHAEHAVAGVALAAGDVIELTGTPDGGEPLRIDYLDFVFVDDNLA